MADVSFNNVSSNKNVINFFHNVFSENPGKSGFTHILSLSNHLNINIEKKSLENTLKLLDKCKKFYQNSKLNLKNSPPFLIGTINDIQILLNTVIQSYKDKHDELLNISYFKIMLLTIIDKSEQVIKIFKDGKDRIFDSNSSERKKLTRLSLIFSHLYKTFHEFFQKGVYCVDMFRITKLDAANWWKVHFNEKTIVPWKTFYDSLSQTCKLNDINQSLALQNTINLCCNNYITIYEFDVFVRLFQPWNNILETWKALAVLHPGYMSFMTYDDVRIVLMKFIDTPGPGTYVFRSSCTKLGQWAIGYITEDKQIVQTIIQNKSLARAILDGEKEGYYKYPNGSTTYNGYQDLYSLVHNLTQTYIQVSHEQYTVYCYMDSTFELCKICSENGKNIRLEPCQHLLCRSCLISWQSSSGHNCPFCRLEIKSTEEIIVKPYNSSNSITKTENPNAIISIDNKLSAPPIPPRTQMSASSISSNGDETVSATICDSLTHSIQLNYATLDFQDQANLSKSVQVDPFSEPSNNIESNTQILIEQDLIDEKVAKLVLTITENDITKSRMILKYFQIKDDIF